MADARHAISSIDSLPDEAQGLIQWAISELEKGKRTDSDILFEFNNQLAVMGVEPISRSAFGRYALKKRVAWQGTSEFRMISAAFAKEYGPGQMDDMVLYLSQMILTAIHRLLTSGSALPAKAINDLSRAVPALMAAQKLAAGNKAADEDRKDKQAEKDKEREAVDKVFDAADAALVKSGREDGRAYLKRIRQEVYNIYDAPEAGPEAQP